MRRGIRSHPAIAVVRLVPVGWRAPALLLTVSVMLGGCGGLDAPGGSSRDWTRATRDLASVFPLLERLQVHGYYTVETCRYISYARGAFITVPGGACRIGRRSESLPLDDQAQADIDTIVMAMAATGRVLQTAFPRFDDAGRLLGGAFSFDACHTLVFDADHRGLPASLGKIVSPVDIDWWVIRNLEGTRCGG